MNNFNLQRTIGPGANCGDINIGDVSDLVGGEGLGSLEDLVRDAFRCRRTVCQVVFDTEIFSRA